MKKSIKFLCPSCGPIFSEEINLYNENLRKQNFDILPILPTCRKCGSEVSLVEKSIKSKKSKVIVITGTCASGKSAIAEVMMREHEYAVIDGDCATQVAKYKTKRNKLDYNEPVMYEEIGCQIDTLRALNKNIVLSHVVTIDDIDLYRDMLKQKMIYYKIVILLPDVDTAILRSKDRTCHDKITPEKWVKHFDNLMRDLAEREKTSEDVLILDNSNITINEAIHIIIKEISNILKHQ